MQCGEKEKTIRKVGVVEVECFKCGEKGHKCKKCPLWVRKEKAVCVAKPQKMQERRLRRVEERKAAHMAKP